VSIPKIIHQVWSGPVPLGIQECLDSVKRVMPDYEVVVHKESDMDKLVPEQFSLVERTNLYRNRLLYSQGGWWIDADCYALRPLNSDQSYSFGRQERSTNYSPPLVVDWAFGSEAGNSDLIGVLRRLAPSTGCYNTLSNRRSSSGQTTQMLPLGEHMAKELGGKKLEPCHVYGSRRFSHRKPSKLIQRGATLVHLFLGSWYAKGWRNGVINRVKEVERW